MTRLIPSGLPPLSSEQEHLGAGTEPQERTVAAVGIRHFATPREPITCSGGTP